MADETEGVADGEEVAREAILEVQLAFAGTLVATTTAVVWWILDELRASGTSTAAEMFGVLIACVVLQLYVVDHSWFLALRGGWLGAVLIAL